jgi:hypothetical protein
VAVALVLGALSMPVLLAGKAFADAAEPGFDVGIALRFMPIGWMNASEHDPHVIRTVPAVGGAIVADYRVNPFFAVGVMPELTLNVIPKVVGSYPVSSMTGGSLRFKAQIPGQGRFTPYVVLAPGYSAVSSYHHTVVLCDCADSIQHGDSHGFTLAGYAGARLSVSPRHAVLVEAGYLHGFQSSGSRSYAPRYLVLGLGWQASL